MPRRRLATEARAPFLFFLSVVCFLCPMGTSGGRISAFAANGNLGTILLILQTMSAPTFSLSGPFNAFALKYEQAYHFHQVIKEFCCTMSTWRVLPGSGRIDLNYIHFINAV